jgi:signal transduction histidine kinase
VSVEIAGGNYSRRIESVSKDEVGQLAGQFNVMADALEQHIDELEQMIQRREQFVADFTHEIKTPMTTIIGYADTMRSMELTEKERLTALNYIFSEGKRLENLSHNLFDLVYLNHHELKCTFVSAKDFSRQVEQVTTPLLQKKKISLVSAVEEGRLWINSELFAAALVNLIDNARKATDEGGSIYLYGRNRKENGCYEFEITDFGIGMSEEEREKMCDEFYMADKSRARKEGGAGLGMSLVKLILERHQAVWNVESERGKGTKITIQIKEES